MRRLRATSAKRALWDRLPAAELNLDGLKLISLSLAVSPVRKNQRFGSRLYRLAYSARAAGVSRSGSTVIDTKRTSGYSAAVWSWRRRMCVDIIGQGPSQFV